MTIEIHKPELEALITQRMKSGEFHSVEDVLMQALEATPPVGERIAKPRDKRTGAVLITALQASPHREIEIEPARYPLPVRDVTF